MFHRDMRYFILPFAGVKDSLERRIPLHSIFKVPRTSVKHIWKVKCFFQNIPRGNFKDTRDAEGGLLFRDPSPIQSFMTQGQLV